MAVYLFTKNKTLLHEIQSHLAAPVISVMHDRRLKALCRTITQDPHPLLIIDEGYHTQGVFPLLEYMLSSRIPGPKLFIPERKSLQSSYASDGSTAVLYRPFTGNQLIQCLLSVSGPKALDPYLKDEHRGQVPSSPPPQKPDTLVGESRKIREIRNMISTVGTRYRAIHITGETGSGKEVVADMIIHCSSPGTPVEKVNCSAITPTLSDAFLFGSKKGSYTDSKEDRQGCIDRAHRGILFLDEIEDFPYEIQGKLLRVLETGEYLPIGSECVRRSDFQLLSLSNENIGSLSRENRFRKDLYHRIAPLVISLPPLRDRLEDIPLLAVHYLNKVGEKRELEEESVLRLMNHTWPGNVRELFNTLESVRLFTPPETPRLSLAVLPDSGIF